MYPGIHSEAGGCDKRPGRDGGKESYTTWKCAPARPQIDNVWPGRV